jgi:hypothetical protein
MDVLPGEDTAAIVQVAVVRGSPERLIYQSTTDSRQVAEIFNGLRADSLVLWLPEARKPHRRLPYIALRSSPLLPR